MGEPVETFRRRLDYRKALLTRPGERRLRYSRACSSGSGSTGLWPTVPRDSECTIRNRIPGISGSARAAQGAVFPLA
jgi:hypothetical protein